MLLSLALAQIMLSRGEGEACEVGPVRRVKGFISKSILGVELGMKRRGSTACNLSSMKWRRGPGRGGSWIAGLLPTSESGVSADETGEGGVADGIRTRNNKLHKLGLYH